MMDKKILKTIETTDEMTVVDKTKAALSRQRKEPRLTITLTIVQGSESDFGKTYSFTQDTIVIGRSKDNSIQLDDRKVSKNHCEISIVRTNDLEQIAIKDLSSTNGTYVNGEVALQRILTSGDKIAVGETVLRFNYNDEVEEEYHSKLFTFAATDSLTGLYNRRYILNELEKQRKIAKRNNRVFSIAILDIDNFKNVNDSFGHPAGDEYLKKIAFIINHTLREQDIAGRVGGEEFLVLLPETDIEGAFQLANRIRQRVECAEILFKEQVIHTTISAGVCEFSLQSQDSMFITADRAMYEAKRSGKNRVFKAM